MTYDSDDLLTSKTYSGDVSQSYSYTYKTNAAKILESITVNNNITVTPEVDPLGRSRGKTVNAGDNKITEESISYIKFGDHATVMPSVVRFAEQGVIKDSFSYKYDSMGNICEVKENGKTIYRYEYDALGRLTREDNKIFGRTYTWDYDCNGNILLKTEYPFTTVETKELEFTSGTVYKYEYTYAPGSDRLLSYGGSTFTYDGMGNPTTHNYINTQWNFANQLTRYSESDFEYDAFGRRTSVHALINYEEYSYTCTYDSEGRLIKQSNGFEFFYDHTGVFAFKHNNSMYYYRKNPQHDIIAILDTSGNIVVKYYYDAWGRCNIYGANGNQIHDTYHLGNLNPFKYRSYYQDIETGLYYLENRYYDPFIGRFISPDDISYLDPDTPNGLNLYAYCRNNPVMYVDYNGRFAVSALLISVGIGAVLGGIYGGISAALNEQNVWAGIGIGAVTGGLTSLITVKASIGWMIVGTFLVGAGGDVASQVVLDKKHIKDVNINSATLAGVTNAGLSLLGKGLDKIGHDAGLGAIENLVFSTITNSPLVGLGMAINIAVSSTVPQYTFRDIKLHLRD